MSKRETGLVPAYRASKETMICPKRQRELHVQTEICPYCGIVFENYLKYHPQQTEQQEIQPPIVTIVEEDEASPLKQLLFRETRQSTLAHILGRS